LAETTAFDFKSRAIPKLFEDSKILNGQTRRSSKLGVIQIFGTSRYLDPEVRYDKSDAETQWPFFNFSVNPTNDSQTRNDNRKLLKEYDRKG
jgi:hypothetical protein